MSGRKRVLIVDDDLDCREILDEFLSASGFDTMTATNGQEALETLRSSVTLPHVILLDLMMPVMGGETFREHQLSDPRLSAIPTALLSASSDALQAGRRMKAAVLRKPFSVEQVLELVRDVAGDAQ